MAARQSPESLRLFDFSDRELIAIVQECANSEGGWAQRRSIAAVIFPYLNGSGPIAADPDKVRHALRCTTSRLSWMKYLGIVEKRVYEKGEERLRQESEWALTTTGKRFLAGTLDQEERDILMLIPEDRLLNVTNVLTQRYQRASQTGAHLIRREWQHGTHPTRRTG
jgi:hypothetical protein